MWFLRKIRKRIHVEEMPEELDRLRLSCSLSKNISLMKTLYADVDTVKFCSLENPNDPDIKICIVFTNGVVDSAIINENIIKPITLSSSIRSGSGLLDVLLRQIIQVDQKSKTGDIKAIVEAIADGDAVLFADGSDEAILMNTKCFATRSITEPENEKTLRGPKEGFNEHLLTNLSMIRRKVRSTDLKMKMMNLGRRTQTMLCVCYMEGIVNKNILENLLGRLRTIDIDGVLDTNYISELIKDSRVSPFPSTGYTEKPDVVIGKLLEGRIAIFLDGTPAVITVPYLFIENFQSAEDYYINYYYASFSRALRMLAFIMTLIIPGFYVAIVAFHHEMLPTNFLINIATERQSVPLPASAEAFIMVILFDILRETGVRMPSNIGQALSIVGALVIGQSAVEARMVAAPMIIVVALTGITALLVPRLNAPIIYIRLMLLLLASTFGLYGLILGISFVVIHVLNLRSLGVAQVMASGNLLQEIKDTAVRSPWWQMTDRSRLSADRTRQKGGGSDE